MLIEFAFYVNGYGVTTTTFIGQRRHSSENSKVLSFLTPFLWGHCGGSIWKMEFLNSLKHNWTSKTFFKKEINSFHMFFMVLINKFYFSSCTSLHGFELISWFYSIPCMGDQQVVPYSLHGRLTAALPNLLHGRLAGFSSTKKRD